MLIIQLPVQNTDDKKARHKPVGDWISAPSPNVVDPQTMTRLNDPQMKILGSKFWVLGGLNQKLEKKQFVVFVMEN